jgi:Fe-Mn family superoxide dismutase
VKFNHVFNLLENKQPITLELDTLLGEAKSNKDYTPVKLPYSLNALEPFIDEQTMSFHYNKHYKGYVNKLNELISSRTPLEELVKNIKGKNDKVRFNAGGAYNHQLFWNMLSPEKTKPNDTLQELIDKKFGSMDKFKEKFLEKATTIMGSGWCWLVIKDGKLDIVTTPNQDNPLMDNLGTPLLGIDMWEHAYYLKHGPDKQGWGKDFFKVVNWNYANLFVSQ